MDWLNILVASFLSALVFLSLVFIIGARQKRFDIIDSAWGLTFIIIAATGLILADSVNWWQFLVFGLVVLWGVRLAWHIGSRFIKSQQEDRRYTLLRSNWPQRFLNLQVFLRIYLAQAVLAVLISIPVIIIIQSPQFSLGFAVIGVVIWMFGFIYEVVADYQLKQFVADPANKGKLMEQGLWRYSRHPNYFGEIILWWGIGIVGLGANYGIIGLIGPLTITLLILFVSGIPPAERNSSMRLGWETYKNKTNMLVPWLSKTSKGDLAKALRPKLHKNEI